MEIIRDAWKGKVKPTQAEDLAELVAERNMKVELLSIGKHLNLQPPVPETTIYDFLPILMASALLRVAYPILQCLHLSLQQNNRSTIGPSLLLWIPVRPEAMVQVLIVHGDKDGLVPLRNSIRLASLLPNTELKVMKNAGHVPHEERPEEFLGLVDAFMAKL